MQSWACDLNGNIENTKKEASIAKIVYKTTKFAVIVINASMVIKRDNYLQKIYSKKGNGKVKIITGIRRCGKSYLLFQLYKDRLMSEGAVPSQFVEILETHTIFTIM